MSKVSRGWVKGSLSKVGDSPVGRRRRAGIGRVGAEECRHSWAGRKNREKASNPRRGPWRMGRADRTCRSDAEPSGTPPAEGVAPKCTDITRGFVERRGPVRFIGPVIMSRCDRSRRGHHSFDEDVGSFAARRNVAESDGE